MEPRLAAGRIAGQDFGVLVGRGKELDAIDRMLREARGGRSGALILHGDAGIGKTAMLEAAARLAGEEFLVLRASGVESEAQLPYASLHQLLHPLIHRADALPPPQRESLRGAFGLDVSAGADRMLVGLATLTLLADAADEQPVLCAIDDAHWVDPASLEAIAFALRRLTVERVAALLAFRPGYDSALLRSWAGDLRLEALSDDDSKALLAACCGDHVPLDGADAILRTAAGNPLALIELAGTSEDASGVTTLEERYAQRIQALGAASGVLLGLAAADDAGEVAAIAQAAELLETRLEQLEPAEAAGLVAVAEGRVRFKHPLVRSAAYKQLTFSQRRRVHEALARVIDPQLERDRRAWHLAAAALRPDETIARELEESASRARARSGYAAASTTLERAARLSPAAEDRVRRIVDAADAARLAGHAQRALALLDGTEIPPSDVRLRVGAARIRGLIEAQAGTPAAAVRILLDAAETVLPLDARSALELVTLAQESAGLASDIPSVVEFGRWGPRFRDGETLAEQITVRLLRGFTDLLLGHRRAAVAALREAAELGEQTSDPQLLLWAAEASMFLGEDHRLAGLLRRAVSESRARGAMGTLPFALHLLAGAERRLGNIAAAHADADESLRLARETGQDVVAAGALSTLTALAAFRGDTDGALALANETRALAAPRGLRVALVGVARALADLDLAHGRGASALERLSTILRSGDERVVNQPYALFSTPLYVEAALRCGEPERAIRQLRAFESWSEDGNLGWASALVARCRALVAADEQEAEALYEEALERHAAAPSPFEEARTRLLFGEMLRRARRKSEARAHLRHAADTFDALDASAWAARATAELRATGATTRRRVDATRDDLTPQELQIVRLVARGHTNPETAAQLFLSPKTVQYHLRKVFSKLGVASRQDLVRLVAEGAVPGALDAA